MQHPSELELLLLADGELRGRKLKRLEEHVRGCSECSAVVESTRSLGSLVRLAGDQSADDVDLAGLADVVVERLRAERRPGLGERLRVWASEVLRHRKRVWVPSLAAACAAAAVAALVLGLPQPPAPTTDLPRGSSAVSVSFGASVTGALFQLEGKDGTTTAVIWVSEEKPEEEVNHT